MCLIEISFIRQGELYHSDGSVGVPTWNFRREGSESWSWQLIPLDRTRPSSRQEDKAYGRFPKSRKGSSRSISDYKASFVSRASSLVSLALC